MKDLMIRPLEGLEEREACVELQRCTWGRDFSDRVPPSILMLAQELGGVASGAFLGDRLVGFVFGITGVLDGEVTHWSDMLAVDPELRGHGIGRKLKLHQRELLLGRGTRRMVWTFDPLESRNAHLNLHRLGATARTYRRDFYGASDSPLHAGIGTDRLLCEWDLASDLVTSRLSGDAPRPARKPDVILNPTADCAGAFPNPGRDLDGPRGERIGVLIPRDIQALKAADPSLAFAWRENVRAALELAFREGYVAVDFASSGDVGEFVLAAGLSL